MNSAISIEAPKSTLFSKLPMFAISLLSFWLMSWSCSSFSEEPFDNAISAKFSASDKTSHELVNHQPWSDFLHQYLSQQKGINLFDYARVSDADKLALQNYIHSLENTEVLALNRGEQFAYWINLYNATTVKLIIDHYPLESIKDIKPTWLSFGPWKQALVTVDKIKLSLDDIEHKILRPLFKDPRIHYAVNCASISCPNLQDQAFTSENLEALLDLGARSYINHPRGVTVRNNKVIASSIYKWYADDFGSNQSDLIHHFRDYAEPSLRKQLNNKNTVSRYEYDWRINTVPDNPK